MKDEESSILFIMEENRLRATLAFSKRCVEASSTVPQREQWLRFVAMDERALQAHLDSRTVQTQLGVRCPRCAANHSLTECKTEMTQQ